MKNRARKVAVVAILLLPACDLTDEGFAYDAVADAALPTIANGKITACTNSEKSLSADETQATWEALHGLFDPVTRSATALQYRVNNETRTLRTADLASSLALGMRPTGATDRKIVCNNGRVSVGLQIGNLDQGGTLFVFGYIEKGVTAALPDGNTLTATETTALMAKVRKVGFGLDAQWVKAGDPRN